MRATEAVTPLSNASATSAVFTLRGGKYGVDYIAGSWGTGGVTLEVLGPDGSTYIPVASAVTANGYSVFDLPPGSYKLVIPGSGGPTGVYATITRIPGE